MAITRVMTASHLQAIQQTFDNGICYHITVPERVDQLTAMVSKYARPLDCGIPTSGTAFLRLNTTVKIYPNKESWSLAGGAIVHDTVQEAIDHSIATVLHDKSNMVVAEQSLTAWILNEWDRYVVAFELQLTLKDMKV